MASKKKSSVLSVTPLATDPEHVPFHVEERAPELHWLSVTDEPFALPWEFHNIVVFNKRQRLVMGRAA